jgi:hypothetical protein
VPESPSAKAAVPPPTNAALSAAERKLAWFNKDDDEELPLYKLTNILLHEVSTEMTFFSSTIQADGDMQLVPHSELAELVRSTLGCEKEIKNTKLNKLALTGHWLLTCFLHNTRNDPRPSARRETTPMHGICSNLRKRVRTSYDGDANAMAAEDSEVAESDEHGSSDDGDANAMAAEDSEVAESDEHGSSDDGDANAMAAEDSEVAESDEHGSSDDRNHGISGGDDDDNDAKVRGPRRWERLEEERLLAYRREERSMKWIYRQFPHRTKAAIRNRACLLDRRKVSARSKF